MPCDCGKNHGYHDCLSHLLKFREDIKKVIEEWTGKTGHEACWYYPDLFNKIASLCDIKGNLPSITLEEFQEGCKKFQHEFYENEK